MKKYLLLITILITASLLFQTLFILNKTLDVRESFKLEGKATASANLCITPQEPKLSTTCKDVFNQSTRTQNNSFTCEFYAETQFEKSTDENSSIDVQITLPSAEGLFLNKTGNHTLSFDANDTGTGSYTIDYIFNKGDGQCNVENVGTYDFQVRDINDPPAFEGLLTSQQLEPGQTLSQFFLEDRFSDPDHSLDELNFSVHGADNFNVSINDSTREITITNPQGNCEADDIFYKATDPENATADSNMVTLESLCEQEESSSSGGGGGSNFREECTPQWSCSEWGECRPNGTQVRECNDLNNCNEEYNTRWQEQECEYEEEEEPEPRNEEEEENQTEEEEEEEPEPQTPITPAEEDRDLTTLFVTVALTLFLLTVIYKFRDELRTAYYGAVWYLTRKKRKQILLSQKEKEDLLNNVEDVEKKASNEGKETYSTKDDVIEEVTETYRKYFSAATGLKFEFTSEDVTEKIEKIPNEHLKKALRLAEEKNRVLEKETLDVTENHVMLLIEELRLFILVTSETEENDYNYFVRNLPVGDSLHTKILHAIFNGVQALQFEKVNQAKKKYLTAKNVFEDLPDDEKEDIEKDIQKLYEMTTYILQYKK